MVHIGVFTVASYYWTKRIFRKYLLFQPLHRRNKIVIVYLCNVNLKCTVNSTLQTSTSQLTDIVEKLKGDVSLGFTGAESGVNRQVFR
jgi:hypothetical protein